MASCDQYLEYFDVEYTHTWDMFKMNRPVSTDASSASKDLLFSRELLCYH